VARTSDTHPDGEAATPGGAAPHLGAGPAASDRQRRDGGRVLRVLALIAVAVGLAGLTAAACVLSYSSIHHLAIQAGVPTRLARVYPLIFDALLVLAGCSVLALRGAGIVSRVYGWLCMLLLLGGLATGGALHAAATKIPRRLAGVVAAIVPWVLVLIGFGLLLALLRYARIRRLGHSHAKAAAARQESAGRPVAEETAGGWVAEETAGGWLAEEAAGGPEVRHAELQLRARIPRQSAHEQAEAHDEVDEAGQPEAGQPELGHSELGQSEAGQPGSELNPAPIPDSAGAATGEPSAFRRTRSSPTPPQE
jgi:Protein of unknown function (DUF2637)